MKIDLNVLKKLAKSYGVGPAASMVSLQQALTTCEKAPANYEPILTGAGYVWSDSDNAYVFGDQKMYFFPPKKVFIWIWDGALLRLLQGSESIQKWVQGNADYPEGKVNSFMGIYKEMTGQSDASAGGAGVAVADPEADDEIPPDVTLPAGPASEPTDIEFTGTGDRGKEYVPQPQNPADMLIKQIQRKAKVNPDAKLSKQAPIRLPTNDIIDLFQQAQKMEGPDKEKLMAFIKTIKPLGENIAKASTINELVRIIVKGVLNEVADDQTPEFRRKYSAMAKAMDKRLGVPDTDARRYVVDLANKLWPDRTDPSPNARGNWRVNRVKQHPSGEISYLVAQDIEITQTRHIINKGNEWYYFNPDAKGEDRKWKKVTDSEVRVPRVPGEEGDAGYANENADRVETGLGERNEKLIIQYLKVNEDVNFEQLAAVLTQQLGKRVTGEQLYSLYLSDVMGNEVDEMTGTAAASPVSVPFAFSRRGVKEEDDYSELARDNTLRSNCCGAPPMGEVDRSKSGRCSKCKDGAVFSRKVDEMTTTGDVAGYNIPAAFSRRGGSKRGVQGSEKLGYTLTGAGKKEMQRSADKLLEGQ